MGGLLPALGCLALGLGGSWVRAGDGVMGFGVTVGYGCAGLRGLAVGVGAGDRILIACFVV